MPSVAFKHNCISPSYASIPPELVLCIFGFYAPLSFECALSLSQVCKAARKIALPYVFRTVVGFSQLQKLPLHSRKYVRNAWIEKVTSYFASGFLEDRGLSSEDAKSLCWVWSTVHNISATPSFVNYFLEHNEPLLYPPQCRQLNLSAGDTSAMLSTRYAAFADITHLHIDQLPTRLRSEPVLQFHSMPKLTHLAFRIHVGALAADMHNLLEERGLTMPRWQMIVLICAASHLSQLLAFSKDMLAFPSCEHVFPMVRPLWWDIMRDHWIRDAEGGEDFWARAARLKTAVIANDTVALEQLWSSVRTAAPPVRTAGPRMKSLRLTSPEDSP